MDVTREKVIELLYECVEELNEQLDQSRKLAKTPQTRILGGDSTIDSLRFVNLVASIEEKCQQRFGRNLILTESGEKTEGRRDPFESVGTLAEYVELSLLGRSSDWK